MELRRGKSGPIRSTLLCRDTEKPCLGFSLLLLWVGLAGVTGGMQQGAYTAVMAQGAEFLLSMGDQMEFPAPGCQPALPCPAVAGIGIMNQ